VAGVEAAAAEPPDTRVCGLTSFDHSHPIAADKPPVAGQRGTVPFCSSDSAKSGQSPAGHWYLPEDYAFCERARRCGYKIMADTTIRLWHHGSYGYTWEDAGKDKERYETFYFNVEQEA
jgi:hypothetical protein